jgi:hypothetical protein
MWRWVVVVVGASGLIGCIQSNRGSRVEMTLVGIPTLQRGLTTADADNPKRHYELWATLGQPNPTTGELTSDVAVRLFEGGFTTQSVLGRLRRDPLPTPDADPAEYLTVDPCMIIPGTGERTYYKPSELAALKDLLGWTDDDPMYLDRARAQKRTVDLALNAIIAVTSYATRSDVAPDTPIGTDRASWEASNAERLKQCNAFFRGDDCDDDACRLDRTSYFVGNADEMTYPVNGIFYGVLGEGSETQDPWSHGLLGAIEVTSAYNLRNLVGLFVTVEDDVLDPVTGELTVDPQQRGTVLVSGEAQANVVRGMLRVDLRSAAGTRTMYGTASVYYSLDSDPVLL